MIGIYFSGTGNTSYCVKKFTSSIDKNIKCFSIEDNNIINEIKQHKIIILGFPIYYSNIPKIVKDFLSYNKKIFKGKKVFFITTKGVFNAFGVGYAVKTIKNFGGSFIGSLQLNMPDNIRDMLIMEILFSKKYSNIIVKADMRIEKAAIKFKENKTVISGLTPFNYIIGFILKHLWFYPKTDAYISAPNINYDKCNGCGKCASLCPTKNINVINKKAVCADKCTLCYRCFNNCPQKAITVLGKKVYDQYTFEKSIGRYMTEEN